MALIHRTTLTPTKPELLRAWLPSRPWAGPGADAVEVLGAFRFDDPDGEVGVETLLLDAGDGVVLQVPLTYRGAPLEDAEDALVGTTEHGVLGTRWVYDGCADPVWATTVVAAVLTGGTGAEELYETESGPEPRETSATVQGSGQPGTLLPPPVDRVALRDEEATTVVAADGLEVTVARVVGTDLGPGETLTGRWDGGGPAVLAVVRSSGG